MTRRILIKPRASVDLDEQFAYIAANNFDAALRFFDSARQTFSQLAQMPGIGSLYAIFKFMNDTPETRFLQETGFLCTEFVVGTRYCRVPSTARFCPQCFPLIMTPRFAVMDCCHPIIFQQMTVINLGINHPMIAAFHPTYYLAF
jgi:hypothetical protein